eukprot:5872040-Pleurochrysis_carterae.AAC.1
MVADRRICSGISPSLKVLQVQRSLQRCGALGGGGGDRRRQHRGRHSNRVLRISINTSWIKVFI